MRELPEKFPEYSIMYKTLSNQIKVLEKRKTTLEENEINQIQMKIQNYQMELLKIKKMFPEKFFEEK